MNKFKQWFVEYKTDHLKRNKKMTTSCRAVSSDSKPIKQVIWSRKSSSKAMPAYKANALTAGIPEREPVGEESSS